MNKLINISQPGNHPLGRNRQRTSHPSHSPILPYPLWCLRCLNLSPPPHKYYSIIRPMVWGNCFENFNQIGKMLVTKTSITTPVVQRLSLYITRSKQSVGEVRTARDFAWVRTNRVRLRIGRTRWLRKARRGGLYQSVQLCGQCIVNWSVLAGWWTPDVWPSSVATDISQISFRISTLSAQSY